MICRWQVESDSFCLQVLAKHWPDIKRYKDVRNVGKHNLEPVNLICGGDPCPIRSKASTIHKTKHPDLSGYFLAVVGQCRPQWVVRENVPAPDDIDFVASLEMLGYRVVIIATNPAKITAQNRERDFVVGCPPEKFKDFISQVPVNKNDKRYAETKHQKTEAYPLLTVNSCRWDARDGYIWDGTGLRVANSQERQKLTGLPDKWLDQFSRTQVAKMTGNAVVSAIPKMLGTTIMQNF